MAPSVVAALAATLLVCLALVVAALRLSQFQSELRRLAQAQDGMRLEVQRGRKASLLVPGSGHPGLCRERSGRRGERWPR